MLRKCCRNRNVPVALARNGTMIAAYVFAQFRSRLTRSNSAMISTSVGSIRDSRTSVNAAPFSGKRKYTNASAASRARVVFPAVTHTATTRLFSM